MHYCDNPSILIGRAKVQFFQGGHYGHHHDACAVFSEHFKSSERVEYDYKIIYKFIQMIPIFTRPAGFSTFWMYFIGNTCNLRHIIGFNINWHGLYFTWFTNLNKIKSENFAFLFFLWVIKYYLDTYAAIHLCWSIINFCFASFHVHLNN